MSFPKKEPDETHCCPSSDVSHLRQAATDRCAFDSHPLRCSLSVIGPSLFVQFSQCTIPHDWHGLASFASLVSLPKQPQDGSKQSSNGLTLHVLPQIAQVLVPSLGLHPPHCSLSVIPFHPLA